MALGTLIDVAARLRPLRDGGEICLLMLGDGAAKRELMAKAEAMDLDTVRFIDSVPKDEVARYWALLDIVDHPPEEDEPLFKTVIPSKLFEAMAMGIPVLHGVEGESARHCRKRAQLASPSNRRTLRHFTTASSLCKDRELRCTAGPKRREGCAQIPTVRAWRRTC